MLDRVQLLAVVIDIDRRRTLFLVLARLQTEPFTLLLRSHSRFLKRTIDQTSRNNLLCLLLIDLEGKAVEILAGVHFIEFAEMLGAINVFVVANEFLERAAPDLGSALLYLLQNLQISVSNKAVLIKPINNFIHNLNNRFPVFHYLLFEFELDLDIV